MTSTSFLDGLLSDEAISSAVLQQVCPDLQNALRLRTGSASLFDERTRLNQNNSLLSRIETELGKEKFQQIHAIVWNSESAPPDTLTARDKLVHEQTSSDTNSEGDIFYDMEE